MKKTFKHLEPGDILWQVLETSHNRWEIVERPVTDVQWPYQKLKSDYCFMKMLDSIPIGVGHETTYEDDLSRVAVNGPLGFVLDANTDQERDIYINKEDAEKARLTYLYAALNKLDREREEILYEIEKRDKCSDEF